MRLTSHPDYRDESACHDLSLPSLGQREQTVPSYEIKYLDWTAYATQP